MALSKLSFKDRLIQSFPILGDLLESGPMVKQTAASGAVAGDVSVTGIKFGDELISVVNLADGADLTSEFSITDDGTINNAGGTATDADTLLVMWHPWSNG